MKRKFLLISLILVCVMVLASCGCKHEVWNPADCVNPKTCAECGETEGAPLGHSWIVANCVDPKTCEVCAATDGEPLGHTWTDATYEAPKTCSVCAATEGDPLAPPFLGTWAVERYFTSADMGITDFAHEFAVVYHYTFDTDGRLIVEVRQEDADQFMADFRAFFLDYVYFLMEQAYGMDRDALDAALALEGSSMADLADASLADIDLDQLLDDSSGEGTYVIKDGELFITIAFEDAAISVVSDSSAPVGFSVEGDTLTLNWEAVGDEPLVLTRKAD